MLDFPLKLFPPALLAGTVLYGGATILWLQPLVEKRMAEKHLIPQCETALRHSDLSRSQKVDPEREAAKLVLEMFRQSGIDKLPGVEQSLKLGEQLMESNSPKKLRRSSIERVTVCSCAVDSAFQNAGFSMTAYVGSARTYAPASIRKIQKTVSQFAHSSECSGVSGN